VRRYLEALAQGPGAAGRTVKEREKSGWKGVNGERRGKR